MLTTRHRLPSVAALRTLLTAELRDWRFEMSGGRTKNVKRARTLKADIARVKTVMAERARTA